MRQCWLRGLVAGSWAGHPIAFTCSVHHSEVLFFSRHFQRHPKYLMNRLQTTCCLQLAVQGTESHHCPAFFPSHFPSVLPPHALDLYLPHKCQHLNSAQALRIQRLWRCPSPFAWGFPCLFQVCFVSRINSYHALYVLLDIWFEFFLVEVWSFKCLRKVCSDSDFWKSEFL